MLKKTTIVIAFLCAAAQGAWAQNPEVKYIERSWDGSKVVETEQTITDYTLLEGDHREDWMHTTGTFVVKGDVTYKTLNVYGDARIILLDDATLTCTGGIKVEKDNDNARLYIYSQSSGDNEGKLIVTNSYDDAAGIGSSIEKECGEIYIHGGNLDITGGKWAAGIGAGGAYVSIGIPGYSNPYRSPAKDGTKTIYGGTVAARGGEIGAGIGGGCMSSGGSLFMYGGEVTAIGGELAAGVGGGGSYHPYFPNAKGLNVPESGQTRIYGGKLTATGGERGAGIGSGNKAGTNNGQLWIYDGATVIATGGTYAAGIGGGGSGGGDGTPGMAVTIYGGHVEAFGGEDAAGIGGGECGDGGETRISGGFVRAVGKSYGSGIGGGECTFSRDGDLTVGGNTYITGGTVIAIAGEDCNARKEKCGSAIGCGDGMENKDAADNLRILEIADDMRVTGGDAEDNIERVFTSVERVGACIWRNYVKIEPCDHTTPTVGSDLRTRDIVSMEDDQHTIHCHYCGKTWTGAHYFPAEDPSTCQECGYVRYDPNAPQIIVTFWFLNGEYMNELGAYSTDPGPNGREGQRIVLPTPGNIEGLQFVGYMQTPASLPSSVIMQDNEDEATLLKGGEVYTLNSDHAYDEWGWKKTNLFARYLYVFTEKWEWAEDYSSVKLTLSNKYHDDVVLTSEDGEILLTSEEFKDWRGEISGIKYVATATYQSSANGHVYTFSSETKEKFELMLADNADNSAAINRLNGREVPIFTDSRKFYTDGSWNTICLPFDVDVLDIQYYGFNHIKTLSSSAFDPATGTLTLNFVDSGTIEAGKPYLVRWDEDVYEWLEDDEEPHTLSYLEFKPAVIDNTLRPAQTSCVDFVGSFSPVSLTANDRSVLYLGADNKLYYPSEAMTVGSCRAVFQLNGITSGEISPTQGEESGVRRFILNFGDSSEAAEVTTPLSNRRGVGGEASWFTLDGRRLSGKPTAHGIYICNGKKIKL